MTNSIVPITPNDLSAKESNISTFTYKFEKPFTHEDKTYEELTFNWGKLTGADSLAIQNEVAAMTGRTVIAPVASAEYLVRMASRACATKIGIDVLMAMPLLDFNSIESAARNFLLKLAP